MCCTAVQVWLSGDLVAVDEAECKPSIRCFAYQHWNTIASVVTSLKLNCSQPDQVLDRSQVKRAFISTWNLVKAPCRIIDCCCHPPTGSELFQLLLFRLVHSPCLCLRR